jgi:SAM-dependent methyltransferase
VELDRSAKVVFDRAAVDYDRYRPGYPEAAVGSMVDLSALAPRSRLLEVGCGTGQATLPLAARGFHIDAIELGTNLAAIATDKCARWPRVHVTVGAFESFELPAGSYDLVYSAQAFHWIDPKVRLEKSARFLKEGGSLALLYNCTPRLDGTLAVLSDRLQTLTGAPVGTPQTPLDMHRWQMELTESRLFQEVRLLEYPWSCIYNAEEYKGLFRTYSDFRGLSGDLQGEVAETIERTLEESGGTVTRQYVCTLLHARKAD